MKLVKDSAVRDAFQIKAKNYIINSSKVVFELKENKKDVEDLTSLLTAINCDITFD